MTYPAPNLVTPELVRRIRAGGQLLIQVAEGIQASIETGRFDEAAPKAAELGHALREHVLLVDGVLEALTPDDISPGSERR